MKKIIVNGTFDILHRGHIMMLAYARSLGDELKVCIDTDRRIQELKGPTRPINNEADRVFMLESLRCVTSVAVFDDVDDLVDQIKQYQPDIMVKGSDYQGRSVVGEAFVPQVIYYDRIQQYSTTKIIQHIINRG
jgi:D-beta-D-heptose 7-phosphate kinase/D-beta-D-heptose 1-phosphate adenosyltransferase